MNSTLKKFLFALLFTIFSSAMGFASPLATFNYKVFYAPNQGPIVETYLDISGRSIMLKPTNDELWSGKVEITLIFKKGDDIVTFDKKILESPPMGLNARIDFIDIQRFALPPGNYEVEIVLKDANDEGDQPHTDIISLYVAPPKTGVFISHIELISGLKKTETPNIFSKSGFDIIPMVGDNHLNENMAELLLYCEIYNTDGLDSTDMFLVKAYMADTISNKVVAATVKYNRKKTAAVCPVIIQFPITGVSNGFYNIIVEAVSRENKILSRQALGVYRSHPGNQIEMEDISQQTLAASWAMQYTSKEEMFHYIRCLRPIATDRELITLDNTFGDIDKTDLTYMQHYFYTFWTNRNETESELEWLKYKEKVKLVEDRFGTRNKQGYETDRGRVFLKYGQPNDLTDIANEPSAYPYQIWRYYHIANFNNVRFVFYDPMLTGRDYDLLHCETIPGETYNPSWKSALKQRTNITNTQGSDEFGERIDENFNNPR